MFATLVERSIRQRKYFPFKHPATARGTLLLTRSVYSQGVRTYLRLLNPAIIPRCCLMHSHADNLYPIYCPARPHTRNIRQRRTYVRYEYNTPRPSELSVPSWTWRSVRSAPGQGGRQCITVWPATESPEQPCSSLSQHRQATVGRQIVTPVTQSMRFSERCPLSAHYTRLQ